MSILAAVFILAQQAGGRSFEEQVLNDLSPAAAVTADGNSNAIDLGDRSNLRLLLDCTARSGTNPTMDITIQHSHDGTTWATLGTFTQLTATGSERKVLGPSHRYVRAVYDIGGTNTPSFTFTITGTAN